MTTKIPAELSSTPSIVDNGNSTAMTIDSSEQIGIGSTAPNDYDNNSAGISSNLVVKDSGHSGIIVISGTSSDAAISFGDGTGTAAYRGAVAYVNSADALYFKAAGANKLRLDSDGLKFGSDTAAANALDDYEEGTWTPIWIGNSSNGSPTYSTQVGSYTKIGNTINARCHLIINGGTLPSGALHIYGLPFASSSSHGFQVGSVHIEQVNVGINTGHWAYVAPSVQYATFRYFVNNAAAGYLYGSHISTATDAMLNVTYRI